LYQRCTQGKSRERVYEVLAKFFGGKAYLVDTFFGEDTSFLILLHFISKFFGVKFGREGHLILFPSPKFAFITCIFKKKKIYLLNMSYN
jgi:hypothetical protein